MLRVVINSNMTKFAKASGFSFQETYKIFRTNKGPKMHHILSFNACLPFDLAITFDKSQLLSLKPN